MAQLGLMSSIRLNLETNGVICLLKHCSDHSEEIKDLIIKLGNQSWDVWVARSLQSQTEEFVTLGNNLLFSFQIKTPTTHNLLHISCCNQSEFQCF